MKNKLISVISTIYNTKEEYLTNCFDSIFNNSYKNIEFIIVNDGSTTDIDSFVKKYQHKYKNIKYVNLTENIGLFRARLKGLEEASGEYVTFIDSDDTVSVDYFRLLLKKAVETNADMTISSMVIDHENGGNDWYNQMNEFPFKTLKNTECFETFINQEYNNYFYHTIWGKLYKKTLLDKCWSFYQKIDKHLIMFEDIAYTFPLWYFSKRVEKIDTPYYGYFKNDEASTSTKILNIKKYQKYINDIETVVNFVETFLKEVDRKYLGNFGVWKNKMILDWEKNLLEYKDNNDEKAPLLERLAKLKGKKKLDRVEYPFYQVKTKFNDKLEKLKLAIIDEKIKVVSFDIFDTLVTRPFYEPVDLFRLMNRYFQEINGKLSVLDFSDLRIKSEQMARRLSTNEEITINDIYKTLGNQYYISSEICKKLMKKEIELEQFYCRQRKTVKELFDLALELNKKIIITSDMYLDENTVKQILKNNDYDSYSKLYLSSTLKLTKNTGKLFEYLIRDLKIDASSILHIGDNSWSDVTQARKSLINACLFPKAIDVFMGKYKDNNTNYLGKMFDVNLPFWEDVTKAKQFLGIRCSLALAANKIFDNPFVSFNQNTNFNYSPSLIGYYAAGMQSFGITNWLYQETKDYDNLLLVARDGFLFCKTYDLFCEKLTRENHPQAHYFRTSRTAIVPLSIEKKVDVYGLYKFLNKHHNTVKDLVYYLEYIIKEPQMVNEILKKNKVNKNKLLSELDEEKIFKLIIDELLDEEKMSKMRAAFKNTFNDIFDKRVALFDIGYSAKPSRIFSNIFKKPIDTFFVSIDSDVAYTNATSENFKLSTFFNYRPTIPSLLKEKFYSELSNTTQRYYIKDNKVDVEYGYEDNSYYEQWLIGIIQKEAVNFNQDMLDYFAEYLDELYMTNYYVSIPLEMLGHSSFLEDRKIVKPILFEDHVWVGKENTNLYNIWNDYISKHKQKDIQQLLSIDKPKNKIKIMTKNPILKLILLIIYDRKRLIKAIKKKLKKVKPLYIIFKPLYNLYKKLKQKIKKSITKKNLVKK